MSNVIYFPTLISEQQLFFLYLIVGFIRGFGRWMKFGVKNLYADCCIYSWISAAEAFGARTSAGFR